MKQVQPIRDRDDIARMKDILRPNIRNYTLFIVGLNCGLRISDILTLKVRDVSGEHIEIKEKKTGKTRMFLINDQMKRALTKYIKQMELKEYDYLFPSNRKTKEGKIQPISRIQAYRILNKAAKEAGLVKIGTHTMRKTYGYHFYKQYKSVAELMEIFNHSSPDITLIYIGINQDEKDKKMRGFGL